MNGCDYFGGHPGMRDERAMQRGRAPGLTTQAERGVEETVLAIQRFHLERQRFAG